MLRATQHKIRSFVLRAGKLTNGQKRAMTELLPQFLLDEREKFDKTRVFNNDYPVYLDIGFGNGESLIHIAKMYPAINFIGMEVHAPGIGHLLLNIEKYAITNIRIYQFDGVEILNNCFGANSIDALHIYFPDPWHKKRHHKRRLIQPAFVQSIIPKLKVQGRVHIATDWQQYALYIQQVFAQFPQLQNIEKNNAFTQRPKWRPITKFERRGINLGHDSYDLIYNLLQPKAKYKK
ncbi:tRNA (guanine(46)-N(7))-methyltransferase [hydrothermal vent metagenome]|uniref:tRNA (guanine(46)-N(7))-methyltransferase n=1 Tax=hydrothermal vent metagenome TaxID=652676 RepID=A0A3B0URF3_9ZZZZ